MLEKIRYREEAGGISVEAYTDGYAYDASGRLYLLSAAGRDNAVQSVTAALLSGRELELLTDPAAPVRKASGETYRRRSRRLPSGALHQVVLAAGFWDPQERTERLLYIGADEDEESLVYAAVQRHYAVPLLPEWAPWLREQLQGQGNLRELAGNRRVLALRAEEEELEQLLAAGVRSGEITF